MITFEKKQRGHTPLMLGVAGPSGSGKSLSALRLAVGLAGNKPVLMINTEGARGHLYAERFPDVLIYDMPEPFSLECYEQAVREATKLEPGCIIIDQGSHAHEGPGGMLDQHDKELDRMTKGDDAKRERMNFAAWIKPKAAEANMIGAMERANCHIVLCLRAKEKLRIVRGKDPEPLGWQPICSDRMSFETTVTFILPPGSKGKPDFNELGSKDREPLLPILREIGQLDEATGRKLAEWAAGGVDIDWEARVKGAADLDALRGIYDAMPVTRRGALRNEISRRKTVLEAKANSSSEAADPTLKDAQAAIRQKDYALALDIARGLTPLEREAIEADVNALRPL